MNAQDHTITFDFKVSQSRLDVCYRDHITFKTKGMAVRIFFLYSPFEGKAGVEQTIDVLPREAITLKTERTGTFYYTARILTTLLKDAKAIIPCIIVDGPSEEE